MRQSTVSITEQQYCKKAVTGAVNKVDVFCVLCLKFFEQPNFFLSFFDFYFCSEICTVFCSCKILDVQFISTVSVPVPAISTREHIKQKQWVHGAKKKQNLNLSGINFA